MRNRYLAEQKIQAVKKELNGTLEEQTKNRPKSDQVLVIEKWREKQKNASQENCNRKKIQKMEVYIIGTLGEGIY